MTKFADIADFDEDKRIDIIGHRAVDHRELVAFYGGGWSYAPKKLAVS